MFTSFVLITGTPLRLAEFLEARGLIEQIDVEWREDDGVTPVMHREYVPVLPGLEWVKVPNPITTAPSSGTVGEQDFVPATQDARHVYLVKFARESLTQKAPAFDQWLANNTTPVTAPANYKIRGGEPAGEAYKVTGQDVWIVRDRPERFGGWQ